MNSKAPRKRAGMSAKARKKYRLVSFATAAALIFTVFGINAVLKHSVSDDDYAVDHPPVVNTSLPGGAQLTDAATTFVYSPETPTPSPIPTETPVPTATPVPTPTPIPTPVPTPVDLEYPYLIELDKGKQVVTVYTIGEDGYYSLVVKQFICSSGHSDKVEDGMYKLGEKYRWKQMENQSFAQYACRISGPYLFHSCCYYSEKGNKLKAHYYDQLGDNVSSGCVRLLAGDAYWIYTNCPTGTPIHVMHSPARDVELLESLKPPERKGNWDPTDPDPKNPYYVSPPPDTTPDPTPALGVTPAPTALWTVHPKLKAWGKY